MVRRLDFRSRDKAPLEMATPRPPIPTSATPPKIASRPYTSPMLLAGGMIWGLSWCCWITPGITTALFDWTMYTRTANRPGAINTAMMPRIGNMLFDLRRLRRRNASSISSSSSFMALPSYFGQFTTGIPT
jgi:hypothetical protein